MIIDESKGHLVSFAILQGPDQSAWVSFPKKGFKIWSRDVKHSEIKGEKYLDTGAPNFPISLIELEVWKSILSEMVFGLKGM